MEKPDQRDYDFSSQEGYDQYDAAVAEYERKKKGPMIGTEFVDTVEDVVKSGVEQISKVPILRTGLQYLGGAVKTVDQVMSQDQGPGGMIYRTYKNVKSASEEGFGDLAENVGVDRRIGEFGGGEIIDAFATAGTGVAAKRAANVIDKLPPGGMSQQLATAGISPMGLAPSGGSFTLRPQVMRATTSPEFTAPGMGQDVSKTAKFAPTVKVYDERTQAYADLVADYTDSFSKGNISADRLKKNLAKVEKNRKGDTSTFEYDPDNPVAYTESISSSFNPYLSTPKYQGLRKDKPRGLVAERLGEVVQEDPYDITKKAQQHHVLAKAETKVFADVLNNLISKGTADKDDLVNFFVWPEQYDLFPGNVLKNLLDMGEITHTVAKKDPMALHTILAQAGLEFGSNTNAQIIKRYGLDKVETADDLMKAYDRYLKEIAIPSKDITYKVQDYWIDKTRKTLKGQELIDFNNRVSKLNDPRKPL